MMEDAMGGAEDIFHPSSLIYTDGAPHAEVRRPEPIPDHPRTWRHAILSLQPLRYLHDCSGCFRLERSPGGICTHWKAPPFHGAHPKRRTQCQDVAMHLCWWCKCRIG